MKKEKGIVDMKGITRIKTIYNENVPGWLVRWCYINKKPVFEQRFFDYAYGSKEQSLNAAILYRDKVRKRSIQDCVWPQSRRKLDFPGKNDTRVPSVCRCPQKSVTAGKKRLTGIYEYVGCCMLYNNLGKGKVKTFSFSEKKWGHRGAFYLAWASSLARVRIEDFTNALQIVRGHYGNHEEIWQAEKARVAKLPKET